MCDLTDEQRFAAESPHKTTFVEAGPGAGKTKTVEARVKHLLDKGVHPEEMAVLTYTRQAASELRSRIKVQLPNCGTFHSVFLKWLEECIGYRLHVSAEPVFERNMPTEKERIDHALLGLPDRGGRITALDSTMASRGSVDYLGILLRCIRTSLDAYREIKHVIVDEGQDLDATQWRLLDSEDALGKASLWVCGDPRQQIFQFRGGTDRFTESCKQYYLTKSFRCPGDIVSLGNAIAKAAGCAGNLTPHNDLTSISQADDVASAISQLRDEFFGDSQIAVLCRYNSTIEKIERSVKEKFATVTQPEKTQVTALLQFIHAPQSTAAYEDLRRFWAGTESQPISNLVSMSHVGAMTLGQSISRELSTKGISRLRLWAGNVGARAWAEMNELEDLYSSASIEEIARDCLGSVDRTPSDGIVLQTMHSSKGREYPAVVFVDDFRRIDKDELRVGFVGFTRTQERCIYIPGKFREFVDAVKD